MFQEFLGLLLPRRMFQTGKWEGKRFYFQIAKEVESLQT